MKRFVLFAAAFLFVLGMSAPAKAACEDVTIGADIIIWGTYVDNIDFDEDTSDGYAWHTEKVKIHLYNYYTDNVMTHVRLDAKTKDSSKGSFVLDRAYIAMSDFLTEGLTLRAGKMSWGWEWRQKFGGHTLYNLVAGDFESAFIFKTKPLGWDATYKFNPDGKVYFGWGKIDENSEPGNNANDTTAYLVRYDHKMGENSKLFVALIYIVDHYENLNGDLLYFNGGIDYFLMDEALELYLEFAYQGGDPHNDSYDFGAVAFDLGAEYTFADVETVPYLGIEIVYYTGDDSDSGDYTYGFQSPYSNWNRTIIFASDVMYNDVYSDTWSGRPNYWSLMLQGGMKSIADDKFAIDVVFAFFQNTDDVEDKGIGWEFDVSVSYFYTEDVTFAAGLGYFSPDDDIAGDDADGALVVIFGVNIDF
ncbi:MAG: hypothetical protein U5N86_13675 [Planctomycetota bacterium]|nr:hypothetical protein [Planctomycetota bacterium]